MGQVVGLISFYALLYSALRDGGIEAHSTVARSP
jgi:hypothetical protein